MAARPDEVCLVPERRQELTTEGGLDVAGRFERANGADSLTARHELGVGVDVLIHGPSHVVDAGLSRGQRLLGEFLQEFGVLFELLSPFGAHHSTGLAGVRARDDRSVFGKSEQCALVRLLCVCLGSSNETCAHPHAVGTEGDGRRESAAVEQPTGRDHRDLSTHGVDHLWNQRHGGDRAGVATAFGSLGDHEVAATGHGGFGVANLAAHRADEDVVLVQNVDDLARYAETGDEDAGTTLDDRFDVAFELTGYRREQVDAERLGRCLLDGTDFFVELTGTHGGGAEGSDSTGFAHGGHESRVRDSAHAGQHHRMFDVEEFGQTSLHEATVAVTPRGLRTLRVGAGVVGASVTA